MNASFEAKSLEKNQKIPIAIANAYLDSLKNRLLYSMKLSNTTVKVSKAVDIPAGMCINKESGYTIVLYIDKSCYERNAFIAAHEFAHLLFSSTFDILGLSDESSDGSTRKTYIQRFDTNNNEYGECFEEACANYLAACICSKLNIDYEKCISKKEEESILIINKLSSMFGTPLNFKKFEGKIDDLDIDPNTESVTIQNEFWYCIVSGNFSKIINVFESHTSENSFKNFCNEIDTWYLNDNTEKFESQILTKFLNA